MLAGHFAVALAGKRIEPRVSLGTLVVAAMAPDLVWAALLAARVTGDISVSHSLLTNGAWAALIAGTYYLRHRGVRGAWILLAVAISHWPLDWIAHWRPDMRLAPGASQAYALGLWNSLPATLAVEGGMWAAAVILYLRGSRAGGRSGRYGFWVGAALLTWAWVNNIRTPPPPNGVASLIFFGILVGWAYGMNVARKPAG